MPSTDREPDRGPSMLVWGMALLSLLMPIAGVVLALYGAFKGFSGSALGWVWLVAGIAILIADLFIDERWSYWMHPGETDLNRRGMQLVGQVAAVTAAIPAGGRTEVGARRRPTLGVAGLGWHSPWPPWTAGPNRPLVRPAFAVASGPGL